MTGSLAHSGDAPQLPWLLHVTDRYFDIEQVLADGAYLSQKNIKTIADLGAEARIPFRETSVYHSPRTEAADSGMACCSSSRSTGKSTTRTTTDEKRGVDQLRRKEAHGQHHTLKAPHRPRQRGTGPRRRYNITRVIHTRYNSGIELYFGG